jgi:serine/threonine protein kinase
MREPIRPADPPSDEDATIVMSAGPRAALAPGTVLGNTYVIEVLLARGGMGEVYRARHIELGSLHAIKVILPSLASDQRIVQLLVEEARKLGRVRNDAIVNYEGFFRGEGNLRYLVMEYIEGESLTRILQRRRLEPSEVLRLRDRLAQGLAAAHERGIIHRDVSPDNIILQEGQIDRAKLIDFGIAKSANPGDPTLIGTDFAGKYSYVSPEQTGLYGGKVDERSDIYSLGLVLAAAAIGYGRKLDMGSSPAMVIAARQRVPSLSEVPEVLRPVIAPMLQPRPDDRPASMRFLLDESKPPGPIPDGRSHPPEQRGRSPLRRVAAILVSLLAVVGIAAAIAYFVPEVNRYITEYIPKSGPGTDPAALRARLEPIIAPYLRAEANPGCAIVDIAQAPNGSLRVSGYLAQQEDIDKLRREIAAVAGSGVSFDVKLRVWPHCQVAKLLQPLMNLQERDAPRLALTAGEVHIGDRIAIDIRAPGFDSYIYVDFYDATLGKVTHVYPNSINTLSSLMRPSHNHFLLGCEPFAYSPDLPETPGEQLITLIASQKTSSQMKPLFADPRPFFEQASYYLADLSEALDKQRAAGANVAAAMLFFPLRGAAVKANLQPCPSR